MTAEQIRTALLVKLAEPAAGEIATALTDGWGAPRLVMAMHGVQQPIRLRPAMSTDEALLLHWANDPQVRANSFRPEPIAPADHHQWFRKGLANPNRLLLVATTADGCPIGQFRLDRQPAGAHGVASQAKLGLLLDRCARGYGLAAELVRLGLQAMEQRWGLAIDVVAEVLTSNTASNACFARAGFTRESELVSPPPASRAVIRWRWRSANHSD